MSRPLIIAAAVVASVIIALLFTAFAQAQQQRRMPCGLLPQIMGGLWGAFQEQEVAGGKLKDGSRVALFLSESGSWSIVRVKGMTACVVASGEDWKANQGT